MIYNRRKQTIRMTINNSNICKWLLRKSVFKLINLTEVHQQI